MATGQPEKPTTNETDALEEARSLRFALSDAADRIEDLVARPASDPLWTGRVNDAMAELRQAFNDHVQEVEADDGLLPQLLADEPRIAHGIKQMYTEHVDIGAIIDNTTEMILGCGTQCESDAVDAIRLTVVDLLRLISRHRQAGADLVYEAYSVDIGGG
jgi:hypothetical protein